MIKKEDDVFVADSLDNVDKYLDCGVHFAKAVAFLQRSDLMALPNGRYDLDGENAFAMVQEVTLKTWGTARPELHREYFDIQLPLTGDETIGVSRFDQKTPVEFDKEKDCGFCDDVAVEPLTLSPGHFAILHPGTCAHAPCCSIDGGGEMIRKIVVKVRK